MYKGIHKISKNVRAIKRITREYCSEEDDLSLKQEIEILKSLVNFRTSIRIILTSLNYMSFSVMKATIIWLLSMLMVENSLMK